MKDLIYLLCLLCLLVSCSTPRNTAVSNRSTVSTQRKESPGFLENITLKPTADASSSSVYKPLLIEKSSYSAPFFNTTDIEKCSALQFKFGIRMNLPVEAMWNEKLILFLDDWYGTPYRYGGATKKGVDCSAFTAAMMESVYGITIPRTSRDQYESGVRVNKNELQQGDLVFFNTTGRVSHVGVYLGNNKFAHASTSGGVMISDLDEDYFSKRYVGSERVR